jgi:plasmid stability protein
MAERTTVALTIRGLDPAVKARLRVRAAEHGRSMEAEVREILTEAVGRDGPRQDLAMAVRERFAKYGGVDLDIPPRTDQVRWAEFE